MPRSDGGRGGAGPVVLVLASGRGERFRASGGAAHKLDALLCGEPVLSRTLQAVRDSGLPWHLERAAHPGMGESLAAAVRATPNDFGWLVLPADMPLLQPATLRAVASALGGEGEDQAKGERSATVDAIVPFFAGLQGHPVAFSVRCADALARLGGDFGARQVLRAVRERGAARHLDLEDEGIVLDVDTVSDLARAETLWQARAPQTPDPP